MKRILAGILAIGIIFSISACNGNGNSSGTSDNNTPETSDNGSSITTPATPLSNPVAVDDKGNVDMEVALAYETDIDALIKELEAKTPSGETTVSKQTNEKTKKVYDWLRSVYGKQMITGQQYMSPKQMEDLVYHSLTDDLPAIKGFDFIFGNDPQPNNEQVDMAIDWHNKSNGLVTMCWHWKVPIDIDKENSGTAFYSEEIKNFSLANAVTPGTKEYNVIIKDIDTIAIQLQRMESAGVPVIWRPLHEASGSWFWWGVADKESYKQQLYQKLWYMVFDRLENYHKLTNLIWLWNGQTKTAAVNANTYDISGTDIYTEKEDHTAHQKKYTQLEKLTEKGKMIALSECGYIPDPEEVFAADSTAKWLYYCPWYGDFVYKVTSSGAAITNLDGYPSVNDEKMSEDFVKKLFAHENVITWKDLPDWGGTSRDLPEHLELVGF